MHNRFDQLGKKIGLEALGPSGVTVAHDEISPDAHHADLRHEPDPGRAAERARLGLLGRMASILCLIEMYSGAPDEDETLACLGKLIAFRQRRRREASAKRKRGQPPAGPFVRPFVWILSAGRPTAVLAGLAARRARGWPRGVYVSPGALPVAGRARADELGGRGGLLRLGVVVASELPRDRSTLLVRLMAAGPLLKGALEDLSALPADAHERAVASRILLGLRRALGSKPNRTTEEKELIVDLLRMGEEMLEKARKKGRKEGLKEGLKEGRKEGRKEARGEGRLVQARAALRRVLAVRKLATGPAEDALIDDCTDLATLERWLDQALTAPSAARALQVPASRGASRARRTAPGPLPAR